MTRIPADIREMMVWHCAQIVHEALSAATFVGGGGTFDSEYPGPRGMILYSLPWGDDRYNELFFQKIAITAAGLTQRMQSRGSIHPRSVAEEMILYATLVQCRDHFDEDEAKAEKVETLQEVLFADHDFLFLFDPKYDGIEKNEEVVKWAGVANLSFDDWFEPFLEEEPVHPYVRLAHDFAELAKGLE